MVSSPSPDKNDGRREAAGSGVAGSEIQQPGETDAGRSNVSAECAKDVGGGASSGVVRNTEKSNPFAVAQGDDAATSLTGGNQQSSCVIAVREDSARTIEAGLVGGEKQPTSRPSADITVCDEENVLKHQQQSSDNSLPPVNAAAAPCDALMDALQVETPTTKSERMEDVDSTNRTTDASGRSGTRKAKDDSSTNTDDVSVKDSDSLPLATENPNLSALLTQAPANAADGSTTETDAPSAGDTAGIETGKTENCVQAKSARTTNNGANSSGASSSVQETVESTCADGTAKENDATAKEAQEDGAILFKVTQQAEKRKDERGEFDDDDEELGVSSMEDVLDALENFGTPAVTCVGGGAPKLPKIPGLHVEGVGLVPVPLTDDLAKKLVAVAQQAPHGRGMETVVDTSVRNTWQIEPSKVRLANPAWNAALQSLVSETVTALGVDAQSVRSELYKLLLYEPGGFFKKHRDTEKADGMFATLVIQLPSCHTGGTLIVSHAGDIKSFPLGAGKDAAYGCHFAAHYADCEHEITKVESGYRLALIYSLCYTGRKDLKPTAAAVSDGVRELKSVLKRLPWNESMFLLPLEHQYTIASLSRFGTGALKGDDRDRLRAMSAASEGTWKFMVVSAERVDYESGGGSYYGGFEVDERERGDPELGDEAWGPDGSDCSADLKWIRNRINFDSIENDGMLLTRCDLDDDDEVWGKGDSGSVEYTGNEGASRETTYHSYFLLARSESAEFELMCHFNIKVAIAKVVEQEDHSLVDRVVRFLAASKQTISKSVCASLLKLIIKEEVAPLAAFEPISVCLRATDLEEGESALFTLEVTKALQLFAGLKDSPQAVSLITELIVCPTKSMKVLLFMVEMALELLQSGGESFSGLLPRLLEKTRATMDCFSGYRPSFTVADWGKHLVNLLDKFGWSLLRPFITKYVSQLPQTHSSSKSNFLSSIDLLQSLEARLPGVVEVRDWCVVACQGVVSELTKPNLHKCNRYGNGPVSSLLMETHPSVFRLLLKHSSANEFSQLEAWVQGETHKIVASVETQFRSAMANVEIPVEKRDMITHFVDKLKLLELRKNLVELRGKKDKLARATQSGPPVFSWRMPNASASRSPRLQAFLRGEQQGPVEIAVGGGIRTARSLARSGTTVRDGYSAEVRATSRTGHSASVVVTKTKYYFNAMESTFRQNAAEVAKVDAEIAKIEQQLSGNSASAPNAAAAPAATSHPLDNVSMNQAAAAAPPSKKQRVRAPIPNNAEVIEID